MGAGLTAAGRTGLRKGAEFEALAAVRPHKPGTNITLRTGDRAVCEVHLDEVLF